MKNKTTEHFDYFYEHYSPKSNKDYKKELLKHKRIAEYNLYQHEKYNIFEFIVFFLSFVGFTAAIFNINSCIFKILVIVVFVLIIVCLVFYLYLKNKAKKYKAEILAIERVIDDLT